MTELKNIERLQSVMNEYANAEVPGNLDPWPVMQRRLTGVAQSAGNKVALALPMGDIAAREVAAEQRIMRPSLSMLLVLLVGLTTIGLGIFASIKASSPTTNKGYDFVPAGKVRHLVISNEQVPEYSDKDTIGTSLTETIDVWFANGTDDYLIRSRFTTYNGSAFPEIADVWERDNMLYTSIPDQKVVLWQAWPYPSIYAPNPNYINDRLQRPDTRIISDTVTDGRHVIVVGDESNQVWVDKDTDRAFQWKDTYGNGGQLSKIVVDEVIDANTLATDFLEFKLPDGYKLKERVIPTPVSTPDGSSTPRSAIAP